MCTLTVKVPSMGTWLKGSLIFVITDSESKVLLSCYGQSAGHDPVSFQSEASAFLAALWIIFLIAEHNNESIEESIANTKKLHLFTDSESMLKNLTAMNTYPTSHLKCTMYSEWDILQVIHILMNKMKERL